MNRTAQKKLRAEMQGENRSDIRRVRRGRQGGAQEGKGNGPHSRESVMTSQMRADKRAGESVLTKIVATILGDGMPTDV